MNKAKNLLIIATVSSIFVAVFYHQMLGFNLFLYNILILGLLKFVYQRFDFKNKLHITLFGGTLLTATTVLMHASVFAIVTNILSLIALFGVINNKTLKTLINIPFSVLMQFFSGFVFAFLPDEQSNSQNTPSSLAWKWVKLVIIPLIAAVIFTMLYSAASSKFSALFAFLNDFIQKLLHAINFPMFFLFCFGFVIAAAYFTKTKPIRAFDEPLTDDLIRKRNRMYFGKTNALNSEFRIGMLTLGTLNILLFLFNCVDIWNVWINFEWNGALLREFVHEGTYTLIFTLTISLCIVLLFFRKNLNFFSKNKPLKLLANIWIIQNGIMAISVLIRNLHYINYYNLAYLRIGVLMFILLVFIGLVTVFLKINKVRNFSYLVRVNMLAMYLIPVGFSLLNWDVIIAKFNFSRSQTAFVHLDFLSDLDEKALPYLIKTESKLAINNAVVERIGNKTNFLSPEGYISHIEKRKKQFLAEFPKRTLLEWNYADWRAYQKLLTSKPIEISPKSTLEADSVKISVK